jgi:hypothetical protein
VSLRSGGEIQEALRTFVSRWDGYAGTERSEAQTFLNELFTAYGADRKEVARFEDPQDTGGIVDCLYPGIAIIEMKRPAEAERLSEHRAQALEYWHHSDDPGARLAAARYVVLCAFQRFEVWEPGRFPSAPLDSFYLTELPDRYEALYFLAGEEPLFLAHRRKLTTDAATVVASLYEHRSSRASADEITQIRYFVLQLVWCLFAESLGLLGGDPVEQIVKALIADQKRSSAAELGHLFSVLATTDQATRGGLYHGAPYVNGGLFASPAHVHLDQDELALVADAARFDWREVDPTIFGSLMKGASVSNVDSSSERTTPARSTFCGSSVPRSSSPGPTRSRLQIRPQSSLRPLAGFARSRFSTRRAGAATSSTSPTARSAR